MITNTDKAGVYAAPPSPASSTSHRLAGVRTRVLAIVLCSLLAGCTNSKLIVGPLYNRLDDQIRSEYEKLGDFSEAQDAAFEQAVGSFHAWHRQSELPQYAALLKEIAGSIAEPGRTGSEDVRRWLQSVEHHSLAARQCYPANFLIDTIRTLDDEQIDYIARRFREQRRKNLQRYKEHTPAERILRRLQNVEKWAGRINLELNDEQRALLRRAFSRQISLRKQYFALTAQWNRRLFDLARRQEDPQYHQRLATHMASLWSLLETRYPDDWQANRQLWQETAFQLVESLTPDQRRALQQWLDKMGDTLLSIARDEPDFRPTGDPSMGCQVDPRNRS